VLARFEAERQALAVMDHPNIAKVLDGGLTEAGRPFFVMEYVKGVPITEYCDATRASVPDRLNLFVQVCQAVQHAHQKGIIHRDLKPSNILVAPYDDKPVPKIIDFGLAKAMHQSLTEKTLHTAHGTVMGTPLYMSPEQAQFNNLDIDTRSDIFSLGVLLYELLTGTTPLERQRFQQAAWNEILRLIREEEPPRPSMRLSSTETLPSLAAVRQTEPARLTKLVRGELDWIVMKAIEKERSRRYETANGFAMDVERYLSGEPVQAAPPSAAYRIKKFARRHRAGLATAAVIAFLLVAGIAVSSWQAYRATRAEGRAVKAAAAERIARDAEAVERRQAEAAAVAEKAARQRAETAEANAKRDLAKFEAINEFLTKDLLTQAEPANNDVEDKVTLLEVLDRAAERVGERFKDQPELEEALRSTIAHTYHGLGSWKKAERQYRAQHASASHRLGPESAESLIATGSIGHILAHTGHTADALLMLKTAADALERIRGADDAVTLHTLGNLALAYREAGRVPEAIAVFEHVRDAAVKKLGADHPDTLTTLRHLAGAYRAAGNLSGAIALLEEVRHVSVEKLGADHHGTLSTFADLGTAYLGEGKVSEAISLLEQVRDAMVKTHGADHPDTLATLSNLAAAYQAAGKVPEAIALLEQVRDSRVKTQAADHPDTLAALNNLAAAYRMGSRAPEAIALLERVRDVSVKKLGADHPNTLISLDGLAVMYKEQGRLPEAISLFEQVRDAKVKRLGAEHPDTLNTLYNLGVTYREAGRAPEAIGLLEQVRDTRVKKLTADHPDTLSALNSLAAAYRAVGKLPQAIALWEQVREAKAKKLGADHPDTLGTLANLAEAYLVAKRVPEAVALFEQVRDAKVKKLGADHPDTLATLNGLARAYRDGGKLPQAIALMEHVRDASVKNQGALHPETLTMLANLGLAYRDAGKLPEAAALFEQVATAIAKRRFQHAFAGGIMRDTIATYEQAGQLDKAEGWRRQWMAVVKEKAGADSPDYAAELSLLGLSLLKKKKWTDAEPILRECLAIREKREPDDWRTFNTHSMTGGALLGEKKYVEAEPLLLKGYAGMKAREEKIPISGGGELRIPEALDRLIELYTATNRADEVKKWQAERAKYPDAKPAKPVN
jgi:tetratricopeptide (TPR) repeat protein